MNSLCVISIPGSTQITSIITPRAIATRKDFSDQIFIVHEFPKSLGAENSDAKGKDSNKDADQYNVMKTVFTERQVTTLAFQSVKQTSSRKKKKGFQSNGNDADDKIESNKRTTMKIDSFINSAWVVAANWKDTEVGGPLSSRINLFNTGHMSSDVQDSSAARVVDMPSLISGGLKEKLIKIHYHLQAIVIQIDKLLASGVIEGGMITDGAELLLGHIINRLSETNPGINIDTRRRNMIIGYAMTLCKYDAAYYLLCSPSGWKYLTEENAPSAWSYEAIRDNCLDKLNVSDEHLMYALSLIEPIVCAQYQSDVIAAMTVEVLRAFDADCRLFLNQENADAGSFQLDPDYICYDAVSPFAFYNNIVSSVTNIFSYTISASLVESTIRRYMNQSRIYHHYQLDSQRQLIRLDDREPDRRDKPTVAISYGDVKNLPGYNPRAHSSRRNDRRTIYKFSVAWLEDMIGKRISLPKARLNALQALQGTPEFDTEYNALLPLSADEFRNEISVKIVNGDDDESIENTAEAISHVDLRKHPLLGAAAHVLSNPVFHVIREREIGTPLTDADRKFSISYITAVRAPVVQIIYPNSRTPEGRMIPSHKIALNQHAQFITVHRGNNTDLHAENVVASHGAGAKQLKSIASNDMTFEISQANKSIRYTTDPIFHDSVARAAKLGRTQNYPFNGSPHLEFLKPIFEKMGLKRYAPFKGYWRFSSHLSVLFAMERRTLAKSEYPKGDIIEYFKDRIQHHRDLACKNYGTFSTNLALVHAQAREIMGNYSDGEDDPMPGVEAFQTIQFNPEPMIPGQELLQLEYHPFTGMTMPSIPRPRERNVIGDKRGPPSSRLLEAVDRHLSDHQSEESSLPRPLKRRRILKLPTNSPSSKSQRSSQRSQSQDDSEPADEPESNHSGSNSESDDMNVDEG